MFLRLTRINHDGLEEKVLVNVSHIETVRPHPQHPEYARVHFSSRNSPQMQWAEALPTIFSVTETFEEISRVLAAARQVLTPS